MPRKNLGGVCRCGALQLSRNSFGLCENLMLTHLSSDDSNKKWPLLKNIISDQNARTPYFRHRGSKSTPCSDINGPNL